MICELSLVDSFKGLSVLVPISKCDRMCPFCYNYKLWDKDINLKDTIKDLSKYFKYIRTFVFGGNNPIGENYSITKDIIDHLRKKLDYSYIELQIATLSDSDLKKISDINPDKVSITINSMKNSWISNIQELDCEVEIRQIYINDDLTKKPPVNVDVVQQIQIDKCYSEEYKKLPQPNKQEVYDYAKSINANAIFTSENGFEKIDK